MFTGKAVRGTVVSFGILIVLLASLSASLSASIVQGQTAPRKTKSPRQQPNQDQEELRREIRELRAGQEAIQKELQEIKRLLLTKEAAGPSRPVRPEKISINGRPIRGNENARVVVVEFSDYQCPYCGLFFRDTMPQLDREYIQAGKIKYVFNNLPIEEIHPAAFKAAQAVECAGEQNKFWQLHDRLFSNQRALSPSDLTSQAKAIELDMTKFNQCLAGEKAATAVRTGLQQAASLGIQGTPAFVIALVDARNPGDTNIKILSMIGGAQPFSVFKTAIDKALAAQN